MLRTVLAATLLVAVSFPFVPASHAHACDGPSTHVGDGPRGPFEDGTWQPCCQSQSVTLDNGGDRYYVDLRAPVKYRIVHEPHPNSVFFSKTTRDHPTGGADVWVGAMKDQDPDATYYAPLDPGSSDVAVEPNAGAAWVYQETNGRAGLQRGGADYCVDDIWHAPDELLYA